MNNLLILFVAVLPVYILCLYVYKKDHDKESKKLLLKLLLFGMISCVPAFILEIALEWFFPPVEELNLIMLFIYIFLTVALVEEGCKWFMVKKIAFNHPEFDHIYDGIVYSVFVSLGFALLENILYVFTGGISVGLFRAISSVPAHACNAIIMGEFIGLAKISKTNHNESLYKKNILFSLIMPTLTHTIYDYCIFSEETVLLLSFVIFLILFYIYSFKKIKKLSNVKNNFINKEL